MGSGTTAVAAVRTQRHFVGYDTDEEYVRRAKERVETERQRMQRHRSGASDVSFRLPARPEPAAHDEDFQARAVREGRAAKEVAGALLEACGFESIERDVKIGGGIEVNFRAYDQTGRPWHFDVSGGFTSNRPGLKRMDTLWKALGKAAVLNEIEPKIPLVLLTTDVPSKPSAGDAALRAVSGDGKPITAVLEILSSADQDRLRLFATHGDGAG
jgi:site-specific DNA-methyltransferase (adenine-specific)